MKIIEHSSNHLILQDSTVGTQIFRLVCIPFLILAIIGLVLSITEQIFPSFFIIFCLIFGVYGVFLTSAQRIYFNKSQNKLSIQTQRLLGKQTQEYPLDNISVRLQETPLRVRSYSSLFGTAKEPIYIIVLELGNNAQKIRLSSNFTLTHTRALEIVSLIQTFLNTPAGEPFQPPVLTNSSAFRFNLNSWKQQVFWLVPLLILSLFWPKIGQNILPGIQQKPMHCSQESVQSPYCDFKVVQLITGHPSASTLAMSADGKTLISGGKDKAIKVWDLQTGTLKKTLQSHSGEIYTVAIAPDHQTIVSGSGDRQIRIWKLTSDQPKILPPHALTVNRLEISSDGKTLISHSDNELKAWDLATGQIKATLTLPYFRLLDISQDGQTVLMQLSNSKVVAWDVTKNEQKVLKMLSHSVQLAFLSLDHQTLVSIENSQFRIGRKRRDPHLKIWDLKTGTLKAEGNAVKNLREIALSRTHLLASTEAGLKIWNLQTAQLEATLAQENLRNLIVSPDGKLLAGIRGSLPNHQILVLQRS